MAGGAGCAPVRAIEWESCCFMIEGRDPPSRFAMTTRAGGVLIRELTGMRVGVTQAAGPALQRELETRGRRPTPSMTGRTMNGTMRLAERKVGGGMGVEIESCWSKAAEIMTGLAGTMIFAARQLATMRVGVAVRAFREGESPLRTRPVTLGASYVTMPAAKRIARSVVIEGARHNRAPSLCRVATRAVGSQARAMWIGVASAALREWELTIVKTRSGRTGGDALPGLVLRPMASVATHCRMPAGERKPGAAMIESSRQQGRPSRRRVTGCASGPHAPGVRIAVTSDTRSECERPIAHHGPGRIRRDSLSGGIFGIMTM
jgi:hypothetical protein